MQQMSAPQSLSVREAAERWLAKQRVDKTEATMTTYWTRIKLVIDFCEQQGIESMSEVRPWDIDEFDTQRRARGPKKVSIQKEYGTINSWLAWAETVGLGQEGIADVLEPPTTKKSEEVNSERIDTEVAEANFRAFRSQSIDGGRRASHPHAFFELMWFTGARMGAIQGLDTGDIDYDAGTVEFVHRPETGTPIKQAYNPERIVGMPDSVMGVLRDYDEHVRHEGVFDDNHRQPFLTTTHGRVSKTTLRKYSYFASVPCQGAACPHDYEQATCDWYSLSKASGCPSRHGPHAVRTGAITNMRNKGWPLDEVAERVNTSPKRIRDHYDFEDKQTEYLKRRSQYVDRLDPQTDGDTDV